MTRDDDLRALADMPVRQPPFDDVTRRAAGRRRKRRAAAAAVAVLAVVGAGVGISVSRDGDGDNVATVDPTVQPTVDATPQATGDDSPPDPAPTTPPEPTVPAPPTPTSATGSTRCSGEALDGEVMGVADVDGDGTLDDIVVRQGPDSDAVVVAHNPDTFGWTGAAELQGSIGSTAFGSAVLAAAPLDEHPGDEALIDVGGNTAWNAAIVSMSDCQLDAVTIGEPPSMFWVTHGASGDSCSPWFCAVRVRCADGLLVTETARPAEAEAEGEFDWYRTTYRIEDARAIEVSSESGLATMSEMPFPYEQKVHCPVPQPALPSRFLGVTTQGEIVEVNTLDGLVGRSWGSLADPTAPLPPNAEIPPNYVEGVWRLGDSPFVYVSPCCEPAGGDIVRVVDDLANVENRFGGWVAVPSPDGLATAFVDLTGASVIPTGVSDGRIEIGRSLDSSVHTIPGGLSWLRDRPGVIWSTYFGDVRVIELDSNYRPRTDRTLPPLGLVGVTVAARGDGAIVIAGCVEDDVGQPCPESRALVVDPDSGETLEELSVEPGTRLGGYDPSGTFLISVDGAGTVHWMAEGAEGGVIAEGYRWATW